MAKKKEIKRKVCNFTAIFEPSKDGGFTVTVPALPGCISEGDTFEEAMENIKEATDLYLDVSREEKLDFFKKEDEKSIIVAPFQIAVKC